MTELLTHWYSSNSSQILMDTNMTGFRWFMHSCALDESSLNIGRVKLRLIEHWLKVESSRTGDSPDQSLYPSAP